jgi:hypothetical protein
MITTDDTVPVGRVTALLALLVRDYMPAAVVHGIVRSASGEMGASWAAPEIEQYARRLAEMLMGTK